MEANSDISDPMYYWLYASTAMKNMKEGMPKAAMFRLEYPFTILSAPQWVGTWSGSLL